MAQASFDGQEANESLWDIWRRALTLKVVDISSHLQGLQLYSFIFDPILVFWQTKMRT
jgi:hypothetical protein